MMKRGILFLGLGWMLCLVSACTSSDDVIATALEQTREVERAMFTALAKTEAAKPTETPTPTPTPKPTPTKTPVPRQALLEITLELSDLPDSFIEIEPSELDISEDELKSIGLEFDITTGEVFTYFNEQDFQIIFGWTFFLEKRLDRSMLDIYLENYMEEMMASFALGYESDILQEEILQDLEGIGDSSFGFRVIGEAGDFPMNFVIDGVVFRRDILVPILGTTYFEDSKPAISIKELAEIMDGKILDVIE